MMACGGLGGSCPSDTNPATFTGLLTTSVPTDASLSGSTSVTVSLNGFQPDVQQSTAFCDSDQRYCGPATFPIVLGAACQVTVMVGQVVYDTRSCDFESSTASVTTTQSCTLDTAGGSLSLSVQSGTFSSTDSSITLTFAGALTDGSGSATLQFQGS